MQIIIEIGASTLNVVVDAVSSVIDNHSYRIEVLTQPNTETLTYKPSNDSIQSAAKKMHRNTISSFIVFSSRRDIAWCMINIPHFCGEPIALWHGSIEYKELEFEGLFYNLLEFNRLSYVVVSMEERLDLKDKDLSKTSFPWNHERLIVGAVKDEEGNRHDWVIKEGPAYTQLR